MLSFCRAGIVEHLFGEIDPLSDRAVRLPWLVWRGERAAAVITCPVMTVIDKCGQATKGVGWMPWHREAMKDVVACDMLREAGKQALIRKFPNAETRLV